MVLVTDYTKIKRNNLFLIFAILNIDFLCCFLWKKNPQKKKEKPIESQRNFQEMSKKII